MSIPNFPSGTLVRWKRPGCKYILIMDGGLLLSSGLFISCQRSMYARAKEHFQKMLDSDQLEVIT